MSDWLAIVLAAGKSTRFKSRLPKQLHTLAGQEMVRYPLQALSDARVKRTIVVVGTASAQLKKALGRRYKFVEQEEQLGTGHAVLQAKRAAEGKAGNILVLNADVPLVQPETLASLMERHRSAGAAVTLLTAREGPSSGLGRIKRGANGRILGIVEDKDATPQEKEIREVNGGVYAFAAAWLWANLPNVQSSKNGEIYLTDMVALARRTRKTIESVTVDDSEEIIGINTRIDLARAEAVARRRVLERLMLAGVTITDPRSTFIDATVQIGEDTVIEPNTYIKGNTSLGQDCLIGPGTAIKDSTIGDGCRILSSVVEDSIIEDDVDMGPFSHLREDTHIEAHVHIGNYGEIKNSRIGSGTKMGHFSYIGDATVGRDVNIGAGTITCNYDGTRKNETIIGDGAFIGSDTLLVAPVHVGARSVTGAGSVVTRDVPPDMIAVGMPARAIAHKNKSG